MPLRAPHALLIAMFLLGTWGCATSRSLPDVNGADCVQDVPQGPDTPTQPYPRMQDYPWMSRGEWCTRVTRILNDPGRAEARLGFMGDSITQMWPKGLWTQTFGRYKPILMGIGGDRTQTLLWRMDHGELKGLALNKIVLLIGTNNLDAGDSPQDVANGIKSVIDEIRRHQPGLSIILMAIFPRGELASDPLRDKIKTTNALLAASKAKWDVTLLDIGDRLVETDGTISRSMMGDFVHLTPRGYQVWADALKQVLE